LPKYLALDYNTGTLAHIDDEAFKALKKIIQDSSLKLPNKDMTDNQIKNKIQAGERNDITVS